MGLGQDGPDGRGSFHGVSPANHWQTSFLTTQEAPQLQSGQLRSQLQCSDPSREGRDGWQPTELCGSSGHPLMWGKAGRKPGSVATAPPSTGLVGRWWRIISLEPPLPAASSGAHGTEQDKWPTLFCGPKPWPCSRPGFTEPAPLDAAGALLPHPCTLACAPLGAIGGVFLWHFPHGFPHWALPSKPGH